MSPCDPQALERVHDAVLADVARTCRVDLDEVEDIYRCTPLQLGTIVESIERGDVYIYRTIFSFQPGVDIQRYCTALSQVVSRNAVLRTRIVDSSHGLVQAVLRQPHIVRHPTQSVVEYLRHDRAQRMQLGSPLFRSAVVQDKLILTMHHAMFDFSAVSTLLLDISSVYHSHLPAVRAPFRDFVSYITQIKSATAKGFWAPRFKGFASHFPPVKAQHNPLATDRVSAGVPLEALSRDISIAQMPAFIEAAWSLVCSVYTGSETIAFGFVMSGRSSNLGDIATTLGPTTTTIPVQVNLHPDMTVANLVMERARERRQVSSSPSLQWGLANIRACSEEARVASNFQTVINIRPAASSADTAEIRCESIDQGHGPYSICLWFTLETNQVLVEADYDPSVIPDRQMTRVLHQFRHVLKLLVDGPRSHTLRQLQLLSPEDKDQLLQWNDGVPGVLRQNMHDGFAARARNLPEEIAVDAWDGTATYGALDDMSTRLALDLHRRGVRTGDSIVLLFDRSLWAIVATLATLRAGACCVPASVAHPRARKETIVAISNAKFVMTTPFEYARSVDLPAQVLAIDEASISTLPWSDDILPKVEPEQLAYIIFTSGSTGTPKGAMLEHRSLVTSLTNLASRVGWTQTSRTLQFASLVWDASLLDIWGALLFGGRVCIPSESERESSLAAYIDSHKVNWALLTPTVLRTLSPTDVPCLETVVSGGEAIDPRAAKEWGHGRRFYNAWGVSEASIVSAVTRLFPDSGFPDTIGRPTACAIWVVNPSDINKLVPIGSIGELVIESPCVARGYLNDTAKTATSFFYTAPWATERRVHPPEVRRFYRTGDLAKYNPDGSICFIGRRDNQVKLRGQRFELNEVEAAITDHCAVRATVATIQKAAGDQKHLVAVLSLADPRFSGASALQELSAQQKVDVDPILRKVQDHVRSTLPLYMVPTFWFVVQNMPRALSAKVDHNAVATWLAAKDISTMPERLGTSLDDSLCPPRTELEKALQDVWSSVFSMPSENIGRGSSFLSLGGDSITAMQVATRLRKHGYRITVATLLSGQSLEANARHTESLEYAMPEDLDCDSEVQESVLSPIQKLFLQDSGPAAYNRFNQSWLLELNADVTPSNLQAAMQRLLAHHGMLRAVFSRPETDHWTQNTTARAESMLQFRHHVLRAHEDLQTIVESSSKSFDILHGPVFSTDLIELPDKTRVVFLAAHHLVIDLVSWRILWEDLEALIQQPDATLPRSLSFPAWVQHNRECPMEHTLHAWPKADRRFWSMNDKKALNIDLVCKSFKLEESVTRALMNECDSAFNTTPAELLLAATVYSFLETFPDRDSPATYVESHGRPSDGAKLDVSRTIGWFTTLFPVVLPACPASSLNSVIAGVKDCYRSAMDNSRQKFASLMYGPDPLHWRDLELLFNFAGRMQQIDGHGGALQWMERDLPNLVPEAETTSLLSVASVVREQRLQFWVEYSSQMAHQDRLQLWVQLLEETLRSMAKDLPHSHTQLTLSDMALLEPDATSLETINQQITELGLSTSKVEMVCPCSPLQEGILLAQVKSGGEHYRDRFVFRIAGRSDQDLIDLARFSAAWQSVCAAHPMLRTIFTSGLDGEGSFQQIVLKDADVGISKYAVSTVPADIVATMRSWRHAHFAVTQPHHHLHVMQVSHAEVYATLDISHALMDAGAMQVLVRDFVQAYTQGIVTRGREFADYLAWHQQGRKRAQEYWADVLRDAQPCLMPVIDADQPKVCSAMNDYVEADIDNIDQISRTCQDTGVTVANFLQAAWTIVLRRYTRAADICFGLLYSGRDAFDGAEEILGPLVSMLALRFEIRSDTSISALLRSAKDSFSLASQNTCFSLPAIQDSLGLGSTQLFNTALSIQHEWFGDVAAGSDLKIQLVDANDPSDYPIAVNIGLSKERMRCRLSFEALHVTRHYASEILGTFQMVIKGMCKDATQSASTLAVSADPPVPALAPFASLRPAEIDAIKRKAASQCEVPRSLVEDVFATTPIQRERMLSSIEGQRDGLAQHVFSVEHSDSLDQLCKAFHTAVLATPALRTRISADFYQIILKSPPTWLVQDDLHDYLEWDRSIGVRFGGPLCRLGRIEEECGHQYIVLSAHDTISDDWTLALILEHVGKAKNGLDVPSAPSLSSLVDYIADRNLISRASTYWKQKLERATNTCTFPAMPFDATNEKPVHTKNLMIKLSNDCSDAPALLQAAWALCLSRLCGSTSVCFGLLVDARKALIPGTTNLPGALNIELPCIVDVSSMLTCGDLVKIIQEDAARQAWLGFVSPQAIAELDHRAKAACSFANVLAISTQQISAQLGGTRNPLTEMLLKAQTIRAIDNKLLVTCNVDNDTVSIVMKFPAQLISADAVSLLLKQYEHAIMQVSHDKSAHMFELQPIGLHELSLLEQRNKSHPTPVEACLQDLIREVVFRQPEASAVCSADGSLSYWELDDFSDRLASFLSTQGVLPDAIVPFFSDRSSVAVVIMLGILKAGGAMLALDPSHPKERLAGILHDVNAEVVICASETSPLARYFATCVLDLEHIKRLPKTSRQEKGQPSHTAYVIYTSGSTGKPKGIKVLHRNIATSLTHHMRALDMDEHTRMLQIANFIFDASVCEVFFPLLSGGCVCMASADERNNDIAAAINRTQANFAFMTPSMARLLSPNEVPTLLTLALMGETMTVEDFELWTKHVLLLNAYGPAEAAIISSSTNVSAEELLNIGRPVGCHYWVVDQNNHDRLVPIGCPGELLIYGPNVAQGYVNDPAKTSGAFVAAPAWTLQFPQLKFTSTFYKTGDLVVQNADGSFLYLGRKDTQIKINGQRIEIGEMESSLRKHLGHEWQVAVEAVCLCNAQDPTLAAFMTENQSVQTETPTPHSKSSLSKILLPPSKRLALELRQHLAACLPSYMIPNLYIPLQSFVLNSSGKTDRKKLRKLAQSLSLQEIEQYNALASVQAAERQQMTTAVKGEMSDKERSMRQLWSKVLSMPVESISESSNWLGCGGNSLKAMKLVAAARQAGLSLSVADVFKFPRLVDMAARLEQKGVPPDMEVVAPFSLLSIPADLARKHAASTCNVQESQVEDVFPATPLQQGLLALTLRRPGDYVAQLRLELRPEVDIDHFKRAWEATVANTPILRTRLVELPGQGMVQVVVQEHRGWDQYSDDSALHRCRQKMGLGTSLSEAGILMKQPGKNIFVWTGHHAIYDGWSFSLLMEVMEHAYRRKQVAPIAPFQSFVKHVSALNIENAASYWRAEFNSLEAPQFPALPHSTYQPRADSTFEHIIEQVGRPRLNITIPTAIRAALAVLLSCYTNTPEAVFGAVISGREAGVPDIARIAGPTLAVVPVRIRTAHETSITHLLRCVQDQAVRMTEFEQTGLSNIQRLGPEAEAACAFQTLLLVQPPRQSGERTPLDKSSVFSERQDFHELEAGALDAFSTYALILVCEQVDQQLRLRFSLDSNVISRAHIERIASQLEHVLQQLCQAEEPSKILGQLNKASKRDMRDIWKWNAEVLVPAQECVHELLEATALRQPEDQAISAWDGTMTYRQLHAVAYRLSRHIVRCGVGPETIVPLLFEKSMLLPICALAVMKAGGASVLLDVNLPSERLSAIVQQTGANLMLCSRTQTESAGKLSTPHLLIVDQPRLDQLPVDNQIPCPQIKPSNALYVVFTSGSTGKPKAIIVTHANFASALQLQAEHINMSSSTRVFDFSSYSFDMAWYNLLHALYNGACLCIPSEEERKVDISGAVLRLNANFICTTPTVAGLLNAEALEKLQTIELAGETGSKELVSRLKKGRRLRNVYGPAECSAVAIASAYMRHPSHIGYGTGTVPWIVQPGAGLAPVGCIGELWLEGPLVARGYMSDSAKTADAFIENPHWLLQGTPSHTGREGRLYRTGDLVRYEEDGSLTFVGREDGQVKIRGQRVELGDVEHHLKALLQDTSPTCGSPATQVVADIVTPRSKQPPRLVAFIVPPGATTMTEQDLEALVLRLTAGIEEKLAKVVPSYMIPSAYVALRAIPTGATGKMNRQALRQIGASTELAERTSDQVFLRPSNSLEATLRDVWSEVLNVPASSISTNAKWSQLGGDSIMAMQALSKCSRENLRLTMEDLIGSQTIRQLATKLLSQQTEDNGQVEPVSPSGDPFALSPIQRWYFEHHPPKFCFDIPLFLRLNEITTPKAIGQALERLVSRHAMLRARFQRQESGTWMQYIRADVGSAAYHLDTYNDVPQEGCGPAIRRSRERLDAEAGLMLSAAFFDSPDSQVLFLTIHHFVADFMSWRIILQDLDDLLSMRAMAPMHSTDFRSWCVAQEEYAQEKLHPDIALPTHKQLLPPDFGFWSLEEDTIETKRYAERRLILDKATTSSILASCSQSHQVQPFELLIALLLHSFKQAYPTRAMPPCFCEGHGREPWDSTIDLTQTVGWFTAIFPVQLGPTAGTAQRSLHETIQATKEAYRSLPQRGWSYFASRYLHPVGRNVLKTGVCELNFNFLGSFRRIERKGSLFGLMEMPVDAHPESVAESRPVAVLDVNGYVVGDKLTMVFKYVCSDEDAERLVRCYESAIMEMMQGVGEHSS